MDIIQEPVTLPSRGIGYENSKLKTEFQVRGFKSSDEMARLNVVAGKPYHTLSKVLDGMCLENPGISCYDFHLLDYQAMLIKCQSITYGKDYKVRSICPICGEINEDTTDLDAVDYGDIKEVLKLNKLVLSDKKEIILHSLTPRKFDEFQTKTKEIMGRKKLIESAAMFLAAPLVLIKTFDGQTYDEVKLEIILNDMSMKDMNTIQKRCLKILRESEVKLSKLCGGCGLEYTYTFPYGTEFFGPSIDD